jgi:glycosyltransferase involved in cell wall biosynthesis
MSKTLASLTPHVDEFVPEPIACLRVALVAPSLRQLLGGQEVQADLLVRCWQPDSELDVVFVPNNPEFPRWLRPVEDVPYVRTLVRFPFYLIALWRATTDSEIVHAFSAAHSSFLLAPVPAWIVARLRRKKTLINYHSRLAAEHLRKSGIARRILSRTDRIVVPSEFLVGVFRDFGIEAIAIPNVVDLTQFVYRHRVPIRPLLLCTRNFDRYCGVDIVVRAFAKVKEAIPEARLVLAGKGKEEGAIRNLVRDLDLGDVEFTGAIARDKVAGLYARAHIFVNGSRSDNMPVSILEAFACGLPVVTTAAGGIPHVVKDGVTGLLCDPEDGDALARNVIRVVNDQHLASTLSHNAHEQSVSYQWQNVRNRWMNVYKSLV